MRDAAQTQGRDPLEARRLAGGSGLSAATVHRIWQKYGLQPHRVELSSSAATPSSTSNWPTSRGSISIRPNARWSCAWTKVTDPGA